ncbi:putative transposase [Burkholderia cenocepacia]|nr:putative transposase [Burkholderia cenocepacia]
MCSTGGERAAAMYSLIGTARLNGLDRDAYLAYVLEHIADHPINRIDELLPRTWRRRCRPLPTSNPSASVAIHRRRQPAQMKKNGAEPGSPSEARRIKGEPGDARASIRLSSRLAPASAAKGSARARRARRACGTAPSHKQSLVALVPGNRRFQIETFSGSRFMLLLRVSEASGSAYIINIGTTPSVNRRNPHDGQQQLSSRYVRQQRLHD